MRASPSWGDTPGTLTCLLPSPILGSLGRQQQELLLRSHPHLARLCHCQLPGAEARSCARTMLDHDPGHWQGEMGTSSPDGLCWLQTEIFQSFNI